MHPPTDSSLSRTRGDVTRSAILAAALVLAAERGFHGVAVPLVAERAGVSVGALYHHFASKDALMNAAYRHAKADYGAFVAAGIDPAASFRKKFRQIWRRLYEYSSHAQAEYTFLELHHHGDWLDAESVSVREAALRPFTEFFGRGIELELVKRADPRLLAALVVGSVSGVVRGARAGWLSVDAEALATAERSAWESVRA